jgi:hypothetical protein
MVNTGKTFNDLPYTRNEALENLMIAALRALRRAKRDHGTNKELASLKVACDQLEYLNKELELRYG